MRHTLLVLGAWIAGALLACGTTYAHHSIDATYNKDQRQTIEGDVLQFLYRSPHSFLHVEVKDKNGEVTRWAIECESGRKLGRQGLARETLKPGDHLTVTGIPGRNPDHHRLWMVSITRRADGWTWTDVRLSKKKIRGAT